MNITKEGIEVFTGQRWENLDKRSEGLVKTVKEVKDGKAKLGRYWTRIDRMHKHSTGWKLAL